MREAPILTDFGPADAGWLIDTHRELYQRDEGFDASFGEVVARAVAGYLSNHDPRSERGWIAWQDGQRIGSIFCTRSERAQTARLRLFLLLAEWRGQGLGRVLLEHCVDQAREFGYRQLLLSTYDRHQAACRLYVARGFRCTRRVPVTAYGQQMHELDWELPLGGGEADRGTAR